MTTVGGRWTTTPTPLTTGGRTRGRRRHRLAGSSWGRDDDKWRPTWGSEWGSKMRSEEISRRNRSSVELSDDEVQKRFSTPAVKTDRRQYRSRERNYDCGDTEHISCYTPLDSSSRRRRVVESYDGVVA